MNDDKIKEILKKDNSIPAAPVGEWNAIEREILEGSPQKFQWIASLKMPIITCSILIFLIFGKVYLSSVTPVTSDQELVEYLFQDDYLEGQGEALYAWVD